MVALIAAAGSGSRLGAGGPKALVELAGRPLLAWSVRTFAAAPSVERAVIAAPPGHEAEVERVAAAAGGELGIEVVAGGETRARSIAAALERGGDELVAVHDAARPLVTAALVEAMVERLAARPDAAGVIAAAPVTDTIKRLAPDGKTIAATVSRDELRAAQTPQLFRAGALRAAHAAEPATVAAATDDAMLVELAGGTVLVEPSSADNLKVTSAADLRLAELLLAERRTDPTN